MNFLAELNVKAFFDNRVTRFLFGVGDAEFSDTAELSFQNMMPGWLLLLIILPVLSLVVLLYYKESRNAGKVAKGVMAAMRILVLLLVLLVFMEPTIKSVKSEDRLPTIVIAVDISGSMNIVDTQLPDEEAQRLAIEIGTTADAIHKDETRLQLVKKALAHKDFLVRLEAMGVVKLVPFDSKTHFEDREKVTGSLAERIEALQADGIDTNVAASLSDIIEATRGDYKVAAIIVISDGRDTIDAEQAAQSLEETLRAPNNRNMRIFTVMVGDILPSKDMIARSIKGPSRVSKESPVRLDLWFTQIGFAGGEVEYQITATNIDTKVTKVVYDSKGENRFKFQLTPFLKEDEISKEIKETKIIELNGKKEKGIDNEIDAGKWLFNVEILKAPKGEIDMNNNRTNPGLLITVTDRLLRVLIVEGAPRWEYRALKNVLLRASKEFQVQCLLLDADPNFPQEHTLFPDEPRYKDLQDATPSLERFPDAEALDKYDVIIWGDVDPDTRRMGLSSQNMENVAKWVLEGHAAPDNPAASGGGMICMFGQQYFPHEYGASAREAGAAALGKVLPCEIHEPDTDIASSDEAFNYKLARDGHDSEVMRFYSNSEMNVKLWETGYPNDGKQYYLPGSYWFWPIEKPNESALVLLRHGKLVGSDGQQGYPLILYQQKGPRAVFAMAIEDTYLWRESRDELFSMFWIRLVKTAAKGGITQGRYSIVTDKPDYIRSPKNMVKVTATILDDKHKTDDTIKARYRMFVVPRAAGEAADGKTEPEEGKAEPKENEIELKAAEGAGNEGKFVAEIPTEGMAAGYYTMWIDEAITSDVEEKVSTQFTIHIVEPELINRTADPELLNNIAKIMIPKPENANEDDPESFGFHRVVDLASIYTIPDNFTADKVSVRVDTATIPIWASWLTLFLALILLSIEWVIRKLRRLI